jgi:hypothetical protein
MKKNKTAKTVTVDAGRPVWGYVHHTKVEVAVNPFALRYTKDSPYSYYDGSMEEVLKLVKKAWQEHTGMLEAAWENPSVYRETVKEGFRDGIILITVPSQNFYSGIAQLNEGDELIGEFKPRKEGEIPRKQIGAKGANKVPAAQTEIILYRSDVLAEDGDNTLESSKDNWEIIMIKASPVEGKEPQNPESLCANHLHEDGGTDSKMTDAEFVEALRVSREFWRDKAMCW